MKTTTSKTIRTTDDHSRTADERRFLAAWRQLQPTARELTLDTMRQLVRQGTQS